MRNSKFMISCTAIFALMAGCGGDGTDSSMVGGAPLSQFEAMLPDGSMMEIEILADDSVAWDGEFAVATETGPYAHQTGTFMGTISGNRVSANCEPVEGESFTLTGSANGKGLKLTRSDIPETALNFVPVVPMAASRGEVSFTLSTGTGTGSTGTSGKATISTLPYSVHSSMTEYRGTWLGLNFTFWAYTSGYASVITYVNDYAINSANFQNLKISDLGASRLASSSGRLSVYSPVTKSQFQFPNTTNVAPL